jgi:hypothetical protein
MDKYSFKFGIAPGVDGEYKLTLPPFRVTLREKTLALGVSAETADEHRLREQANQVAHDLARSLSYEMGKRFTVEYHGQDVMRGSGQQSVAFRYRITVLPAAIEAADSTDLERERQEVQQRILDRTRREAIDVNLRDMMEHWRRYTSDTDGRLHPLYDVLQVVERLYGGRKGAASALSMSDADLSDLGRISNDPTVLNGRHPGRVQGPHRTATEHEVKTCERVARAIIEKQAAKVAIKPESPT